MSLTVIMKEIIEKYTSPKNRERVFNSIQNLIWGSLVAMFAYIISILLFIQKFKAPFISVYTKDAFGNKIFSLIIIIASIFSFYYLKQQALYASILLKKHINSQKKFKLKTKVKNLLPEVVGNSLFAIIFILAGSLIIIIMSIKILNIMPKDVIDSFDNTDIKIFGYIIMTISFILPFGLFYTSHKRTHKPINDAIFILMFFLPVASFIAGSMLYNILQMLDIKESSFMFWLISVDTPLLLSYLIISPLIKRNRHRIKTEKTVSIAILSTLNIAFIIPYILSAFMIIQEKPIYLLSASDHKVISDQQILLIDNTDHFVAYDPVEKYSKVYQKSQYDWKPDRSVKTTESKPAKKRKNYKYPSAKG